jgi:hypothetical protein
MYTSNNEENKQISPKKLKKIASELKNLNDTYGDRVPYLNRSCIFQCPKCRYKVIYNPHENIEMGEARILTISFEYKDDPHYDKVIHELFFVVECRCLEKKLVLNDIILENALRILREERDFVEKGKKRSYEYYVV